MHRAFHSYGEYRGSADRVRKGAIISSATGVTTTYALGQLEARGTLFVGPKTEVYEGMIIGENSREETLEVNPCKEKKLTNMRASGNDETVRLTPPKVMTLEEAIGYVQEDELIEVTPRRATAQGGARRRERRARQGKRARSESGRRDETRCSTGDARFFDAIHRDDASARHAGASGSPSSPPSPSPSTGTAVGSKVNACFAGGNGGNWCIAHANHCSAVMCPEHSSPTRIFPSARVFANVRVIPTCTSPVGRRSTALCISHRVSSCLGHHPNVTDAHAMRASVTLPLIIGATRLHAASNASHVVSSGC